MKYLLLGLLIVGLYSACSDPVEGLIGEWKGTTERVNSKGKLVDVNISCIIKSTTGTNRNVLLTVQGTNYEFIAIEDLDKLIYTDVQVQNDSTGRTYIKGKAVLLNDTLLHFDNTIYVQENNVLFNSTREEYDMVRE